MQKFVYEYATKVYFGEGAAREHLAEAVSGYGKNVMLAYGGGSVKKNGIYDELKTILENAGKTVTDFSGIMSNPTYAKVQEGAKLAKEQKIDFILAVGGGSVIDCCKIMAAQAKTDKDLWEMEMTEHQFPTEVLPMGAVVTASGTGAEMNGGAVITNEEKIIKAGMAAAAPRFAILDPEYTMSLPHMQVISGAFDTLSHAMETYFGNSDQDNVSDDVALAIMRNTVVNMRRLLKNINDIQARSNLMWIATWALNTLVAQGKDTDWMVHMIGQSVGAYTDATHGMTLSAVSLPYYRYVMPYGLHQFKKFAVNVWGVRPEGKTDEAIAQEGLAAMEDWMKEMGLVLHLAELGVTEDMLDGIAKGSFIMEGGYKVLTHQEIVDILRQSL